MYIDKDIALELTEGRSVEDYKVVEQGEWTQEHKSQYRETIFNHKDRFYNITESREGSPFTEWYYDSEYWGDHVEVEEVEKVPITIYEWKPVRK